MSSDEEAKLFAACRALCKQFDADAALVCLKRAAETSYYVTGRTQRRGELPPATDMLPLMMVTRRALLAIEGAVIADPAWRRVLEWQRFVQAIPSGFGITEARLYKQVTVHDYIRLWFEGEPVGELVLPKGTGGDFLLTLGLKPEASGAS